MTQTERNYVAVVSVVDALSNAANAIEVEASLREVFSAIRTELANKELSHVDTYTLMQDWLFDHTELKMAEATLNPAARVVIDAVDQPKMVKPPLKPERLYIQVVPDDADAWQKRAFLCHDYVNGNLAELFALEDYSLREVVEFVSMKLGCPVSVG